MEIACLSGDVYLSKLCITIWLSLKCELGPILNENWVCQPVTNMLLDISQLRGIGGVVMTNDTLDNEPNISNELLEKIISESANGRGPYKLVTGRQTTTGLNFDIKPGAIVAHPGSTVVFVCG